MEQTKLWQVQIVYAFAPNGMTYEGSFYVGANDIALATLQAVAALETMQSRYDKRILSISDSKGTLFKN